MRPNVDQLINSTEEAVQLWNEWAKDAIPVKEARKRDAEIARKVEETEVEALMDATPPIAVVTYETVEELSSAIAKAGGILVQNRTKPTALLGALPEGAETIKNDLLPKWGIEFHEVPSFDPGRFYLFNSEMELYSPRKEAVFNIVGKVVAIRRKDKPNA